MHPSSHTLPLHCCALQSVSRGRLQIVAGERQTGNTSTKRRLTGGPGLPPIDGNVRHVLLRRRVSKQGPFSHTADSQSMPSHVVSMQVAAGGRDVAQSTCSSMTCKHTACVAANSHDAWQHLSLLPASVSGIQSNVGMLRVVVSAVIAG